MLVKLFLSMLNEWRLINLPLKFHIFHLSYMMTWIAIYATSCLLQLLQLIWHNLCHISTLSCEWLLQLENVIVCLVVKPPLFSWCSCNHIIFNTYNWLCNFFITNGAKKWHWWGNMHFQKETSSEGTT